MMDKPDGLQHHRLRCLQAHERQKTMAASPNVILIRPISTRLWYGIDKVFSKRNKRKATVTSTGVLRPFPVQRRAWFQSFPPKLLLQVNVVWRWLFTEKPANALLLNFRTSVSRPHHFMALDLKGCIHKLTLNVKRWLF
jgi:hypothetical protein